jgi:hypothetical protein
MSAMTSVIDTKRGRHQLEPERALSWTEIGTGVWLARREACFAGLVERMWGAGYRVTDRSGHIVGEFATLEGARRQLEVD